MEPQDIREEVISMLTSVVVPAMAASFVVMALVRLLGGRRAGSLATFLAVAAAMYLCLSGVYESNELSRASPWLLHQDQPLDPLEMGKALLWSLEEEKPKALAEDATEEERAAAEIKPIEPKFRRTYWIPWLAALAMILEFLLPLLRVPAGAGWVLRTVLALLAGRLLTADEDSKTRMEFPWESWAVGLVIVLEWGLLTSLTKRWLDGVVPTALGVCCVAAAIVLKIEGYGSASLWELLLGASLVGPALISWKWPSDTSPAAAACAVFLPCLMLEGEYLYRDAATIPVWSYLLAGLAPLALLPVWLPFLARIERWTRWLLWLSLPLIPAAAAVVWAVLATMPAPE